MAPTTRARRLLPFAAAALATSLLPGIAQAAAEPTCMGVPATIVGTADDDVLAGTNGDDVVVAGAGHDVVYGRFGDDIICAGPGNDRVYGGAGDDRTLGEAGNDELIGGPGDDQLIGGPGADLLDGRGGNDLLAGGDGGDHLLGRGGADTLRGGIGGDVLEGGSGRDVVIGGPGADRLVGVMLNDLVADAGTSDALSDVQVYQQLVMTPIDGARVIFPNEVSGYDQRHTNPVTVRTAFGGLVLVERIDPESYLLGIAEVPYSWHPAALRAQAIAARSYLANLVANTRWGVMASHGFDICGSASCQQYVGAGQVEVAQRGDAWAAAVVATTGRILLYQGRPALALYHSTAGETTRSVQDVWPGSAALPYLQSVEVPPQDSPFANWSFSLPLDAFLDILAAADMTFTGTVTSISTVVTQPGGGPYRVRFRTTLGTVDVGAHRIQAAANTHGPALYPALLPAYRPDGKRYPQAVLSPTFTVRSPSGSSTVTFRGQGWGHQLGLPQYGAQAMALDGAGAARILAHFYSGLLPQADPGFLPAEIDVGLGWDRARVTLSAERYVLSSPSGVVARGSNGDFVFRPTADGLVELALP